MFNRFKQDQVSRQLQKLLYQQQVSTASISMIGGSEKHQDNGDNNDDDDDDDDHNDNRNFNDIMQ